MTHEAENPLTEPADLTELVAYSPGSVVSRTLVKKRTGTVTLFAFDAGEGLSEHSSPHDAVVHVLDGVVEISIADEAHRVESGQVLLLPANLPHALSALEPFKMLLIMIRESEGEHPVTKS